MEIYNSWWEEKRSAYLYALMAEHENNPAHKKLFLDLQTAALKQADTWEKKLKGPTTFKLNLRTRIIGFLLKILGTQNMYPILSVMKIRGMSIFRDIHIEHRHTSFSTASNLRAAIFGINDGLISNMSLILGVAGGNAGHQFIVLAGIAGLLAGACSMGAGEYISVRTQREIFEYQIDIEKKELEEYPEEEMEELALIYQARGIPKNHAENLAQIMIENPNTALNTLAREELGLNPEELVSPFAAMIFSFVSFAIGAAIPILPFLFGHFKASLSISMGLTAIALFIVGSMMGLFTNRNAILQGSRMLFIGALAGLITFVIGSLLGVKEI